MSKLVIISRVDFCNNSNKKSYTKRVALKNNIKKKSYTVSSNLINSGLYISVDSYTSSTSDITLNIAGIVSKDTNISIGPQTVGATATLTTPVFQSGNISTWTGVLHLVPDKTNTYYLYAQKGIDKVKYAIAVSCIHTIGFSLDFPPSRITVTNMATGVSTVVHDDTVFYDTSIKPKIKNLSGHSLKVKYGNYKNLLLKADVTLTDEAFLKAMVWLGETITVVDNTKSYIYHVLYNIKSTVLDEYTYKNTGPISWLYKEKKNNISQTIPYYDYIIDENKYVVGS